MTEFLMPFSQSQKFSRSLLLLSCCFLLQNFACHAIEKCLLALSILSVLINPRQELERAEELLQGGDCGQEPQFRCVMPLAEQFLPPLPELGT